MAGGVNAAILNLLQLCFAAVFASVDVKLLLVFEAAKVKLRLQSGRGGREGGRREAGGERRWRE